MSVAWDQVEYSGDPSVLVLGGIGDPRLAGAVAAAGARLVDHVPLGEAGGRLDRQAHVGLVLVLLDPGAEEAVAARLLDRVAHEAADGFYRAVAVLPADMVDLAAPAMLAGGVALLVDPGRLELAAALALAAAAAPAASLRASDEDPGALQLLEISEEVGRIARLLETLAGERDRQAQPPPAPPPPAAGVPPDAPAIRAMIRARRVRDQFFRAELFADPGWDILLDLAAARKEGQGVPVSSLCIAAAVPPTTALRWIKALGDEGLLERSPDPQDGRRVFVSLSDAAAATMDACIVAMRRAAGLDG